MERIDVLKGIEQILVQKAYETGHISHRADGDWQKQADGSWIPYKGQSSQSAPQAQEPTKDTEYGEIIKQDFESVPNSVKDKMFTIAQQYKAEWAEDSDEDIRSMAEDDVEAISQMLWDNADEETRNSWIGSEDSNKEDQYGEPTEEDLVEDDDSELGDYISNRYYNDIANMPVDSNNPDLPDSDALSEIVDGIVEDLDIYDDDQYEKISEMVQNIWLQNNPTSDDESYGDDEVDYTYAKDIDYSQYDDDIKSIEFRENDDGEFEPHDDDYFRVADKIYEQTDREDMSDEEADQLYDEIVDRVIDRAYELHNNVQKSAVRDMRSAPTTKNMGF